MSGLDDFGALDVTKLALTSGPGGLKVNYDGQEYEDVTVRRAFPLDTPDGFIGLIAADGVEIGIVERLDQLGAEQRQILEEALRRTYFLPVITGFIDIGEDYGVLYADVETTAGPRHIEVRGIRSNIRVLSRHRALVEDTDGNRYELPNFHKLPKLTREILGL